MLSVEITRLFVKYRAPLERVNSADVVLERGVAPGPTPAGSEVVLVALEGRREDPEERPEEEDQRGENAAQVRSRPTRARRMR